MVNAGIGGSIRLEGNLEGVVEGGANPAGVDCICKMKPIRDWKKAVCLRLCGTGRRGMMD